MRRTAQSRLNARIGLIAIKLAKRANDPDYIKYSKYYKLYRTYKSKILKKYMRKARQIAIKNM